MLISIIIPVFNEATNIDELINRLLKVCRNLNINYEIIFSSDPCTDDTIDKILSYRDLNRNIKLIKMSRRFGQPAATLAGLAASKGDCIVFMDADLQDPPEVIITLFNKFKEGYDVVHAKRSKRLGENPLRLFITHIGYKFINSLSTTSIPRNVGDFKIISRRVANEIIKLRESNIFIKGLVSFVGFNQTSIEFIREPRFSGKAHYSQLWGSLPQALNGIYCYSNKPLHFLSILGFFSASISFLLIAAFVIFKLSGAPIASGITSILVMVSFFGGLILFSIGILGEYIGRIYEEVKGRPRYIVDREFLD